MSLLIGALLTGAALHAGAPRARAADYFVAPGGSDAAPGTLERPFATLRRAQQAAREARGREPVTVSLREGTHYLPEPLVFTVEDSGTQAAPVEALLADHASAGNGPQELRRRIAQVDERRRNWEKAIDKGVNIDRAIENLKRLDGEKESLERDLEVARTRKTLDLDVRAASREILAGLDRLQEVLEKGSVAEVKAILRAYIGRVEYDHRKNRARVGFLRLPTRALISRLAPESARISVVAGAGFEPATFGL